MGFAVGDVVVVETGHVDLGDGFCLGVTVD